MKMANRHTRIILYSFLSILLGSAIISSCDSCNPYIAKPAVISSFTSASSNITQGTKDTLYFNLKNAKSVKIEADYNGDGTIADSEIDTIADYTEGAVNTFTTRNLDKLGNLEFKLIAGGDDGSETGAKANTNVIAHPLPDLSSTDLSVVEGKTVTFALPTVTGVEYTKITTKNDGSKIVSSSLDSSTNKITVQVSDDVTEQGSYDVELDYNIPETGITGKLSKNGNVIKNLCRIQAMLEISSDPRTPQAGEARQYNEETMASESDDIGRQTVANDGIIDLKANSPADKISFQGFVTGKNSFWAKLSLDGTKDYLIKNGILTFDSSGNVTNYGQATLRTNYYASSIDAQKQRAIWEKVNSSYCGQITPDVENLKVIEILKKNPYSGVVYTTAQQEAIAEVYRNNEAMKRAFRGKDLSSIIQIDGDDNTPPTGKIKNFSIVEIYVVPDVNCYSIVPTDSTSTASAVQFFKDGTELSGIVNRLRIEINPSVVPSSVSENLAAALMHENGGHGLFAYWAHVPDIYGFDSIAATCTPLKTFGGIDYACIDAARNRIFPLRSTSYKTHGLKAGPYD
jgi:hypothetical protein